MVRQQMHSMGLPVNSRNSSGTRSSKRNRPLPTTTRSRRPWNQIATDFAENYTCTRQDETRSAQWKQRQVTVYTVMVYHRGQNLSYIIVSDYCEHEKSAVTAFTSQIMDVIKSEMPSVEVVDAWTDGPSSQYKNKYIFALLFKLQEIHGLQIQWNYFATSHGKGPNDALGGNVKRMAHRLNMARTVIINTA